MTRRASEPDQPGLSSSPPASERELLRRLAEIGWKGHRGVLLGPGDDAAVLRGGLVASADMSVEGVHFRLGWLSAEEVGFRAAAAALSDMAAMGAAPACLLVSLALPADPSGARPPRDAWPGPAPATRRGATPSEESPVASLAQALQRGAAAAGDRVGVPIAGGDLSRSPGPVVVDVAVLGRAARPLERAGARPGDSVWVSGALGGAAAAVAAWSRDREPPPAARARFSVPPNRVPLGRALAADGLASALIDVSDGLVADARNVAARSGVRVCIDEARVPVDASAGADLNLALRGGEDYELMFTVPAGAESRLPPLARALPVPLSRIGLVEHGEGVVMERNGKRRRSDGPGGHDHFALPAGLPGSGGRGLGAPAAARRKNS